MKLWKKDYNLNKEIEKFTVGNDYLLDKKLLKYDIKATSAHATMLYKEGFLKLSELKKIKKAMLGKIRIKATDEDSHTAIENYLTKKLGKLGKKIHMARSRNDQVLVAIKLYTKDELCMIKKLVEKLINSLNKLKTNKTIMPGCTHMRKAMPSSIALWAGAFVDSLKDDLIILETAYKLNDQNPLGSAAGYGLPFKIDKKITTAILGFGKIQDNPIYCQNSRGKIESFTLSALSHIMLTLNKLASDLILFSMPEFDYFSLPKEFCTGSSIMPQKKNPDVLELVRAKTSVVEACVFQINSIYKNLISGYNRDLQLTKEPLIKGTETTKESVKIMSLVINNLKINPKACEKACTDDLYATEKVYELVKKGMPFRDAYKKVANSL